MGGVGGYRYHQTGDINSALTWANWAAIPAGFAGRLFPCFPAGTPILTPAGSTPIEQLRAGDLVLSRDEHNVHGPVEAKVIEETFVRHGEIYELRVGGRLIEVTPEHPLFVAGRGWTPVGEVVAGDRLSAIDGASRLPLGPEGWLVVESNESTGRYDTVYNFRVADHHTYFVGTPAWGFGVWVHNSYGTVGLGKSEHIAELGSDVAIAINRGWTKKGLTSFDSNSIDEFGEAFSETMDNADGIVFNLNGVNIGRMWTETDGIGPLLAQRRGLVTEWELRQVITNREWLDKAVFHIDGRIIRGSDYDAFYDVLLGAIR